MLTLFGIGASVGLTIGGRTADRRLFATLVTGFVGLIVISVAIALLALSSVLSIMLAFLLGVSDFLLNPAVWRRAYVIATLLAGLPISLDHGLSSVGWQMRQSAQLLLGCQFSAYD